MKNLTNKGPGSIEEKIMLNVTCPDPLSNFSIYKVVRLNETLNKMAEAQGKIRWRTPPKTRK
jgi:hypothetical protein